MKKTIFFSGELKIFRNSRFCIPDTFNIPACGIGIGVLRAGETVPELASLIERAGSKQPAGAQRFE